MKQKDIVAVLFDKVEDDDLLDLDDEILSELDTSIEIIEKKVTNFINKRVHPKNKYKLNQLLKQKESKIYAYLHRENELFYKNGVADGVQFMLSVLSIK